MHCRGLWDCFFKTTKYTYTCTNMETGCTDKVVGMLAPGAHHTVSAELIGLQQGLWPISPSQVSLSLLPCEEVRRATPESCSLSLPACRNIGCVQRKFPAQKHPKTTGNVSRQQEELVALAHMLQCVAVCCSVLQCVAVCCSVLQCVVRARKRLERWSAGELSAASPPTAQPLACGHCVMCACAIRHRCSFEPRLLPGSMCRNMCLWVLVSTRVYPLCHLAPRSLSRLVHTQRPRNIRTDSSRKIERDVKSYSETRDKTDTHARTYNGTMARAGIGGGDQRKGRHQADIPPGTYVARIGSTHRLSSAHPELTSLDLARRSASRSRPLALGSASQCRPLPNHDTPCTRACFRPTLPRTTRNTSTRGPASRNFSVTTRICSRKLPQTPGKHPTTPRSC